MRQLKLYKRLNNPLAFTLVELIIIVALMAILAAAVTPAIRNNINKTSDVELAKCFALVRNQAGRIRNTYNTAIQKGEMPRLGGYNLNSARNMQECLRAANNRPDLYDIEVTTLTTDPDLYSYNYIDTIVVSVQFYTVDDKLIKNSKGLPCSPEQATGGLVAYSCKIDKIWYIKKDDKTGFFKQGGAT